METASTGALDKNILGHAYTESGATAENLSSLRMLEVLGNSSVYLRTESGNIYLLKHGKIQEGSFPEAEGIGPLKITMPILTRDESGLMAINGKTGEVIMLTDGDIANGEVAVGESFIIHLDKAQKPGKKLKTSRVSEIVRIQSGALQMIEDLKSEGRIPTSIDNDFRKLHKLN